MNTDVKHYSLNQNSLEARLSQMTNETAVEVFEQGGWLFLGKGRSCIKTNDCWNIIGTASHGNTLGSQ